MVENSILKSKGGWIKLVEVFVSILLLSGVLLIVANRSIDNGANMQEQISSKEFAILRDIELNDALRTEIIGVSEGNLPVSWGDFETSLSNVEQRINELTPVNLECSAKLCAFGVECTLDIAEEIGESNIYAESVVIFSDVNDYSPRELKMFCSVKD